MHRPRVLLLDEPTTGVDPVSRREFWDLLTDVHLDGVTIVVSTPYLDEAERCTRVALMHRGRLVAYDAPDRLRAQLGAVVFEGHSAQARAIEHAVRDRAGVLNASTFGDVVRLIVDEPARLTALETEWQAQGLYLSNMHRVGARLEDVFVMALGEKRASETQLREE
jgi:ABC-2 type transport system ATP-binding protein